MASGRKRSKGLGLSGAAMRAASAGRAAAAADLKVEEDNLRRENAARLLSIEMIQPRPQLDAREVNEAHVSDLVESIRVLGLIQPIYLDRELRLVAGAHRLAAFKILAQENPQQWSKIPVVVDPDLDANTQPELALRKEIVENEKRSNLTPAEVRAAAQRLLESDTGFTRRPGRLKRGERALTPFLAQTFGVSTRYVRSLLNQPESKPKSKRAPADAKRQSEASRDKMYREMTRKAKQWLKSPALEDAELRASIEQLLAQAERSLSQ